MPDKKLKDNTNVEPTAIEHLLERFFSPETAHSIMRRLYKIELNLRWFSPIVAIPLNIYKLIYLIKQRQKNVTSRSLQAALNVGTIALSILGIIVAAGAIYIATPILIIIGAAKNIFEYGWKLAKAIQNRISGEGRNDAIRIKTLRENIKNNGTTSIEEIRKLQLLINNQRERNKKIAKKTHMLVPSFFVLAGAVMLLTPAAPIGAAIILTVAVYGVTDALGLNVFKRTAQGINWLSNKLRGKPIFKNPFAPKTEDDIINELELTHNKKEELRSALETQRSLEKSKNYKPFIETEKIISSKHIHNSEANMLIEMHEMHPHTSRNSISVKEKSTDLHEKNIPDKHSATTFFTEKLSSIPTKKSVNLPKSTKEEDDEGEGKDDSEHIHRENH